MQACFHKMHKSDERARAFLAFLFSFRTRCRPQIPRMLVITDSHIDSYSIIDPARWRSSCSLDQRAFPRRDARSLGTAARGFSPFSRKCRSRADFKPRPLIQRRAIAKNAMPAASRAVESSFERIVRGCQLPLDSESNWTSDSRSLRARWFKRTNK